MIVNYYGILGCECIWDQNGVFLSAPAGVQVQSLQQLGFYTAADGRWFKQLTSQESAYLESRRNMAVVDLPEYGYSGLPYSSEESPEDKRKANILCLISLIFGQGLSVLSFVLSKTYKLGISPLTAILGISSFILMIYVRIYYPKNKFGIVLMTIYSIEAVLILIGVIAVIIMCYSLISSCNSCFNDCRGC
ncbi:hypothetical protein [uncultured Ruminococcus sp.]|uniref:hypothetical protein n=1 Tax=uncultured Ruminococcus sp. TaxID=165186 RepID=UPI0025D33FC1|nr:hypothetical protein [uncultured Ruminococcus sp.]